MKKKVLIISSSPRRGGNSDLLCDEFAKGAENAGHTVEKIALREKTVHYCNGCGVCYAGKGCPLKDDMPEILDRMIAADVIVLASPIYFYTMCGQLKTMIDRCCSRYSEITGKEFYYILTAADPMPDAMDRAVAEFQGLLYCLDDSQERGMICAVGVMDKGDVKRKTYVTEAYQMGSGI